MTISPCDVYTVLVALIVLLVVLSAWCFDRIAEARKREAELLAEIERLRIRIHQIPRGWLA